MPFSGGTYTPPAGTTTEADGNVLFASFWNSLFTDISNALTLLGTQNTTLPAWSNVISANGGLQVWQRGAGGSASFAVGASSTAYTADRWYVTTGANQASVVSQVTGLDTATTAGGAAKILRNNAQTGTTAYTFGYPLDTDEIMRLRGQKISLSCIVKSGANWSPASGTINIDVYFGTGAVAKRSGGFAGETHPLNLTTNLAVSTQATLTGTSASAVPTTATQGEVQVTWTPVGTAGADDSITVDSFSLVAGTNVVSYVDLPFDIMLAQCKRHYRKSFPYSVAPAQSGGLPGAVTLIAAAATAQGIWVREAPVSLRATATYTSYHPSGASANWQNITAVASLAVSLDSAGVASPEGTFLYASLGSTSVAVGNQLAIHYQADAGI